MAPRKKSMSFEDGLKRLEAIAGQMDQGELPLDELLTLYEEGVRLSDELKKKLEEAEGRMLMVRQGHNGAPAVEDVVIEKEGEEA